VPKYYVYTTMPVSLGELSGDIMESMGSNWMREHVISKIKLLT